MCGDGSNPDHVSKLLGRNQIELILTDPPYDMHGKEVSEILDNFGNRVAMLSRNKQIYQVLEQGWDFKLDLVWKRKTPVSFPYFTNPVMYHNTIAFFTKDGLSLGWKRPEKNFGSVIEIDSKDEFVMGKKYHAKGMILFVEILKGFDHNKIADPFLGTGASLLATQEQGKKLFGIEINPEIFAVGLERMADAGFTPVLNQS